MRAQSTGTGSRGRNRGAWRAIPLLLFCWPVHAHAAPAAADIRQQLRAAVESADKKDPAGTLVAILAVIDSPQFDSLNEPTRHAAFSLAEQVAMQTKDFEQMHRMALRATQSTEQSVDDWQYRLNASIALVDRRDEAESLVTIARRWGRDSSMLPDASVRQVLRDTRKADSAVRIDLLQALYELRWRPQDGGSMGAWWLEFSRLLLEQNRTQEAIQAAALVNDPRDIIAFRADRRFRPLLKSDVVKTNPRRAAKEEIETRREATQQRPRSLQALQRLVYAMINSRQDAQALALIEEAVRRIDAAGEGPAPYEDVDKYGQFFDANARALRHLGRFDEAVRQLRRGVEVTHARDLVGEPINLALLLCELDRPDEAMAVLPAREKASAYGKMLIVLVQLMSAVEHGAGDEAAQALSYLREHRSDSPGILQDGLLRAGALDEAEQVLLSRLNDPDERTSVLVHMQVYFEPKLPPRLAQWHQRESALKERPAVRAAIAEFGAIDHYDWTYGYD